MLAPEAMPSSSGRTVLMTRFADGAKNVPMPMPQTISAGSKAVYDASGSTASAQSPRPTALRIIPAPTTGAGHDGPRGIACRAVGGSGSGRGLSISRVI